MSEITVQRGSEIGSHPMHGATGAGRGSSARVGGEASVAGGSSHENLTGGAERPAGSFRAGGAPGKSRFTPDGIERLRASAKARLQNPEAAALRHAKVEAKLGWSDETKANVRQWAADAVPVREIARRLGLHFDTTKRRAALYGIPLRDEVKERYTRAAGLLRQHYPTTMPLSELLELYCEAIGRRVTTTAIETYARKIGLRRPENKGRILGAAARQATLRAERAALAPAVQAMLDRHATFDGIAAALGVSQQRLQTMQKEGLIRRLPKPPAEPKAQPKPPKPPKLATPKPPKPEPAPKPKKLPASWVREAPPPPKPRPTYQTVQEWLDAGGQITRLPAAAVHATTADLGVGRDMIRRHAEVMAQDDGNWITRAKRKMGRFHFGAGV